MIPPGQEGKVSVTVKTAGYRGTLTKSITLETNDLTQSKASLRIKMEIKTAIVIEPSHQLSWDAKIHETSRKTFVIRSEVEPEFDITKIEPRGDDFSVSYTTLPAEECQGGRCYELMVTFQPKAVNTRYTERIAIHSTSAREPVTHLTLFGRVDGNVLYFPYSLNLSSNASVNFGQASATVHFNRSQGGLNIMSANSDNPQIKTFLFPLVAGKSYVLTVVWTGGEMQEKMIRGNITVKTNDKVQEEITLLYSVRKVE
ncbi:MAG: DUF1573 domain-containing protein [bacterium]|nr:DUF1573 domain-containing protein [bacterium]